MRLGEASRDEEATGTGPTRDTTSDPWAAGIGCLISESIDSVMVNLLIVDAGGEGDKRRLVRRRRQQISAIN